MPLVKVNADQGVPAQLARQLERLPIGAPVVVMIHGYRFSPGHARHDPHRLILSLDPDQSRRRSLSWPRALGFGGAHPGEGIALAFGWEARGSLGGAYRRAGKAGIALARILSGVAEKTGRPVALIGHSLGGRVALQAMARAEAGTVGRVILLTGAEFRCAAARAMDSPAGRGAEIINITSRENDLFDFGVEIWLGHGRRKTLGFGLDQPLSNWIDIQIDNAATIRALAGMGFPVAHDPLRLSHWTPYLRGGLFDFYRTALKDPWALPLSMLRARLPGRVEPRWSRLLAAPSMPLSGGVPL